MMFDDIPEDEEESFPAIVATQLLRTKQLGCGRVMTVAEFTWRNLMQANSGRSTTPQCFGEGKCGFLGFRLVDRL